MKNLKLPFRLKIRKQVQKNGTKNPLEQESQVFLKPEIWLSQKFLYRDCPSDIYSSLKHTMRFVYLSIYFKIPNGKGITARKKASREKFKCFRNDPSLPIFSQIRVCRWKRQNFCHWLQQGRGSSRRNSSQICRYARVPKSLQTASDMQMDVSISVITSKYQ